MQSVGEIKTTWPEKLIGLILLIFMMIGSIWMYTEPLDKTDNRPQETYVSQEAVHEPEKGLATRTPESYSPSATDEERKTLIAYDKALQELSLAEESELEAQNIHNQAREAYRTKLDANENALVEKAAYESAQTQLQDAQESLQEAESKLEIIKPDALKAQQRIQKADAKDLKQNEFETFIMRLLYVLGVLGSAFYLFTRYVKKESRYLVILAAYLLHSALLSLLMAVDYLGHYIDWDQIGPLILSLAGIIMSVLAFVAYQKFLSKRVAIRRVKKGECANCGQATLEGAYCCNCGNQVLETCVHCQKQKRSLAPYCHHCGRP